MSALTAAVVCLKFTGPKWGGFSARGDKGMASNGASSSSEASRMPT